MSVRARLSLWSAAVAAFVLVLVSATAYALHVRAQYDDMDRSLATTAEHFWEELQRPGQPDNLPEVVSSGPEVRVLLYGPDGNPVGGGGLRPPVAPLEVLSRDDGPAYDRLLRWLPGGASFEEGAFATTRDQSSGSRVRSYVLPVELQYGISYVLTWASLDQLDESTQFLRLLLIGVVAGGTTVAAGGSFLIAGQALRPVAAMTRAAHNISISRGFARRLEEPSRQDEIGRLAKTFNEMLASLEDAYRMQQRFVADAAHELRAPLTAILANLDLLARTEGLPPEEKAEALSYAHSEARRLSRIVAELLTLARADAGQALEKRPVELDRALLDALAEVRPLTDGRALKLGKFEPAVVQGDPDRLKELVINILDNAIKYTPPGRPITVSLLRRCSEAVLTVRDSGIGIAAADLPHVFERFYRGDPARSVDPGGTGLGLSIARWIADQHSGEISVESVEGAGTTVTVRLPLAIAAGPPAGNSPG